MNAKLKLKWLKALRSGRYLQGPSALANMEGTHFCCLGVLADIQGCTWKPDNSKEGLVPVLSGRKLVGSTADWLTPHRAGGLSYDAQSSLATMNDDGKSFKEIAAYIEANL
jgi:hypothetical protein